MEDLPWVGNLGLRSRVGLTLAANEERRAVNALNPGTLDLGASVALVVDLSHPQHTTETPAAVIRLRSVVIDEDVAKPAVTKECTAEFSNVGRCLHPAR